MWAITHLMRGIIILRGIGSEIREGQVGDGFCNIEDYFNCDLKKEKNLSDLKTKIW